MQWAIFLKAIGLLFIFEGILPFLSPPLWRAIWQKLFFQTDRAVRIMAFFSMLLGLVFVYIARGFYD
jgi:uncharacterized protein